MISVQIKDVSVTSPPNRTLVFNGTVSNDTDCRWVLLRTRIKVVCRHMCIAEGDFAVLPFAPSKFVALEPHVNHHPFRVVVPITTEQLRLIEEQRHGDVDYSLEGSLSFAELAGEAPSDFVLARPRQFAFVGPGSALVSGSIPRSQWVDMLAQLQFSEIAILELPLTRLKAHPEAWGRWEGAERSFRESRWEDVLVNCRKALESVAWSVTQQPSERADMQQLEVAFGASPMAHAVAETGRALSELLHLGRHDATGRPEVDVERRDAEFALTSTYALLMRAE